MQNLLFKDKPKMLMISPQMQEFNKNTGGGGGAQTVNTTSNSQALAQRRLIPQTQTQKGSYKFNFKNKQETAAVNSQMSQKIQSLINTGKLRSSNSMFDSEREKN